MNITAPARAGSPRPAPEPPKSIVEVVPKPGTTDAGGESVLRQLPLLGITTVKEVRVSTLYEISGKYNSSNINRIARELLSDPITQEYRIEKSTPSAAFLMGQHHRVEVWLKSTVSDPVGESTHRAIASLGVAEPLNVRTGRVYYFIGRLSKAQVEKIVAKLLSNPVIHSTKASQR